MDAQQANFPALRSYMGDWTYYVTVMPLSEIELRIQKSTEIYEVRDLEDMVQRELRTSDRVKEIVKYLTHQQERFFNSIIVGVHGGDPQWHSVDVKESPLLGPPELASTVSDSLGIISLTGEEKMFAIDGQHRVHAIKEALNQQTDLNDEHLAVIFVAHRATDEGRKRTRRLFSTLNREARPVSKGEIVALDEDNAFAITARRLVREYGGLNRFHIKKNEKSLVFFGKGTEIQRSNRSSITSILCLYDLIETIELRRIKRQRGYKKQLTKFRPSDEELEGIYQRHVEFWETLRQHISPIAEVMDSDPDVELAGKYRHPDGGHLLFRPAGQKAFAGASRVMMDRGMSLQASIQQLGCARMEISHAPWLGVLWDANAKRMIVRNQRLVENLLLFIADQPPYPTEYDLKTEYKKATGNELPDLIPVNWKEP